MTNATTTRNADTYRDTGRDLNAQELRGQLGMNLLAASGGRMTRLSPSMIDLPVASGYRVRIVIEADDTYSVERVMVRGAKTFRKGKATNVYADQIGDCVYDASCFRNIEFPGAWA